MNENSIAVRQIVWRELFPWLILLRVFRIAIAPGPLLLATGAVAITSFGWWLSGYMLFTNEEFAAMSRPVLARPVLGPETVGLSPVELPDVPLAAWRETAANAAATPFYNLVAPVRRLFDARTSLREVVYLLIGFSISLVVWAFAGGVITRQAIVELATEQPYDWFDSVRFVARRYLQYLLAPVAPLLALVAMGILVVPVGWLMHLDVGVLLAGLLWIFVIALGLIAAWLIVGLVFGWPLMYPVIGSKRDGDALQAFSDSFSYVYGKPLHYLFYAFIALVLGGLALYVVDLFADAATEFSFWAASWGAGGEKIALIREHLTDPALGDRPELSGSYRGGVGLIGLVLALVQTIKIAAAFSYFFASAAAVFLLMRYAVDEKEIDEVHLEEEEEHLETARRAMLSDEDRAREIPSHGSSTVSPPGASVAFDTAAPAPPPPAVNTTEIFTPPAAAAESPSIVKPPGEEDVAE